MGDFLLIYNLGVGGTSHELGDVLQTRDHLNATACAWRVSNEKFVGDGTVAMIWTNGTHQNTVSCTLLEHPANRQVRGKVFD